jgi:Na+/H+-translocating membrane pyrophosphatase
MSRNTHNRLRRAAFAGLCAAFAVVFFAVVYHHVSRLDFQPLAALSLPMLVLFFGFTSLLYVRGRSLGRSKEQLRTLFAAERAMQASVSYLSGVAVGASIWGLLQHVGGGLDLTQPAVAGAWLLAFLLPYALMQRGFFLFMGAVWIIVPQFLHPVSPYRVWRRVARAQ